MQKIEHIGIAVKDLDAAEKTYQKLLGISPYKREVVESEQAITSFFRLGTNKIELLASTDPNGVIQRYIDSKGEGIHHVAISVMDIYSEMERLKSEGFTILTETPKRGADNKLICFVHPKNSHGVLIELCQDAS